MGRWQHVYTDTDGGGLDPLNDTTDIRFAFPGDGTVTYCQHITGAIEVGPNENVVNYTLDGAVLVFPDPAPGYEALAWDDEVMLWKNLGNPAETYVLLKR